MDINVGKPEDLPICLAVQSRNKQMVAFLLDHGISNANIKAALAISWANDQDEITGLLLEHIAVVRSRDLVTLSGLELTKLKPLWILPSLGVKVQVEAKMHRRHKREGSLGHVKDSILHRRSTASDLPVVDGDNWTPLRLTGNAYSANCSRRSSIDISALKYLSSMGTDEPDGGWHSSVTFNNSLGHGSTRNNVHLSDRFALPKLTLDIHGSGDGNDSGVGTASMVKQGIHHNPVLLSPVLCEVNTSVMSRSSFRKQAQGAISGARSLPRSQLDQYAVEYTDGNSAQNLSGSHNLGDFSLSPAQLCRQLRRVHKKRSQSAMTEPSSSHYSSDQSVPVITYQRCQQEDDGSPYSLSSSVNLSLSGPASADSPFISEASVLGTSSDRFEANSDESSVLVTPISSPNSSGGSGIFIVPKNRRKKRSLDSVLGQPPILEQEEVVSSKNSDNLIKVFDLSSNQLQNFYHLITLPYGGKFIFKQLREVRRLDLKQNILSELPMDMMKVIGFLQ